MGGEDPKGDGHDRDDVMMFMTDGALTADDTCAVGKGLGVDRAQRLATLE